MNYNANTGSRQSFGRKFKRVSNVNAVGYNPTAVPSYTNGNDASTNQYIPEYAASVPHQTALPPQDVRFGYSNTPDMYSNMQQQPAMQPFGTNMFSQPIVQDMALQYGQQLASTGKTMMKEKIEKVVPVTKLRYYFSVDTKYVCSKLALLYFPFIHKDWSRKYEQDGGPVQPRFELNAPDLYIPTMAYITYILVAGFVLGTQQKFSSEQISIQASSALAWCLVEIFTYLCVLYIANIQTSLQTLDLVAYSGYKFPGIIVSMLCSIVAGKAGYYSSLAYTSLSLAFFLTRTLRLQVMSEKSHQPDLYGNVHYATDHKKRLYFLVFVAVFQPLLSWWLSFHVISSNPVSQ